MNMKTTADVLKVDAGRVLVELPEFKRRPTLLKSTLEAECCDLQKKSSTHSTTIAVPHSNSNRVTALAMRFSINTLSNDALPMCQLVSWLLVAKTISIKAQLKYFYGTTKLF